MRDPSKTQTIQVGSLNYAKCDKLIKLQKSRVFNLTLHSAHVSIRVESEMIIFEIAPTKGSPYTITERRVPELIPVLGSQPAGDVNHKPGGRLPLLSVRPVVTPATLKRTATNFAAW